jgi:hypothetical protein
METSGKTCCVVCGKTVDEAPVSLQTTSSQDAGRTYGFWVHPACLKQVAKPGFVGIDKL